ncbi:MAG: hypothetical protein IRZ02_09840, partial [Acidothermus sp.]|nr:hypothetical protein [Acidothermus sp.]
MATVTEVERDAELRRLAARLLDRAWQGAAGYCVPNRRSYPHLWLWDSCFHVIAWAALGDRRAVEELQTVFAGQFAGGFLPHIRYRDGSIRHRHRGPLAGSSSFTQPPVYVRALLAVRDAGMEIPAELLDRAASALDALWRDRLRDGLLVVVHPWEAGTDDSPRWDSWVGSHRWRRRRWTAFDREIASRAVYGADGQAIDSTAFVVAPASFNAIAADAARCLGDLLDDDTWRRRAGDLADTLD